MAAKAQVFLEMETTLPRTLKGRWVIARAGDAYTVLEGERGEEVLVGRHASPEEAFAGQVGARALGRVVAVASEVLSEEELADWLSGVVDFAKTEVVEIEGEPWHVHTAESGEHLLLRENFADSSEYEELATRSVYFYEGARGPGYDDGIFEQVGRVGDIYLVRHEYESFLLGRFASDETAWTLAESFLALMRYADGGPVPVLKPGHVGWLGGQLWERTVDGVVPKRGGRASGPIRERWSVLPNVIYRSSDRGQRHEIGRGEVPEREPQWTKLVRTSRSADSSDLDPEADDACFVVLIEPTDSEFSGWWMEYNQLVEAAWSLSCLEAGDPVLRHPPLLAELPDGTVVGGVQVEEHIAQRLADAFDQPTWWRLRGHSLEVVGVALTPVSYDTVPCQPPPEGDALWDESFLDNRLRLL